MSKKGFINSSRITGLIVAIVMITVLLSVASSVIPTGSTAFYTLMTTGLSNTTVLGSGAVTLASNMPSYVGWFWVLGPFVLVIGVIMAIFVRGRRR